MLSGLIKHIQERTYCLKMVYIGIYISPGNNMETKKDELLTLSEVKIHTGCTVCTICRMDWTGLL